MNITHDYDPENINMTGEPENMFFVQVGDLQELSTPHITTSTSTAASGVYEYQDETWKKPEVPIEVLIGFVQTHPDAILPRKNHENPKTGDAGFDLFAVETTVIPAKGSAVVPVGMKLGYISPGYWFRIEARSGNGFKKSLIPHFGIIDNPYRGDLGVKLYNFSDVDQVIEKGAGAAQIIVYKMIHTDITWMREEDVDKTERGEKGFGSSDKTL